MSDIWTLMRSAAAAAAAAAAAISAGVLLVRIIANHPLPSRFCPYLTFIIHESDDGPTYHAVEIYLNTMASASTIAKGKKITDRYWGCRFTWALVSRYNRPRPGVAPIFSRAFEVTFHGKYGAIALKSYIPYIFNRSRALQLYTNDEHDMWRAVNLPGTTFETLAAEEPAVTAAVKSDLCKFLCLKDYIQRKTMRSWKREYLLYGPPGEEKSNLVAAMANFLKYNVYDLNLTKVKNNLTLKRLLLDTKRQSILLVRLEKEEHPQLDGEDGEEEVALDQKATLSEISNQFDRRGFGDERIIVFTTSYKEKLNRELVRSPGRINNDIHITYMIKCTPNMFRSQISNYHNIDDHPLFSEIEALLQELDVTPARVVKELMESDDTEVALRRLIKCLMMKKEDKSNALKAAMMKKENKSNALKAANVLAAS